MAKSKRKPTTIRTITAAGTDSGEPEFTVGARLDALLTARGEKYGVFEDHAALAFGLTEMMEYKFTATGRVQRAGIVDALPDQMQALRTIAVKLARLANGDIDNVDSWTDIAGYALLVAKRLSGQ